MMPRAEATRSEFVLASTSSRLPEWLAWALVAAIAAPLGIILHELGHFATAHAFGFPDIVLSYGSVASGAAKAGAPAWQQALTSGAGPLVTFAIVGACCLAAARFGARAWTVAPAFAAGIRSVLVGTGYGVVRLAVSDPGGNMDELNFARGLGLPPDLVMAISTLVVLSGWAYLILLVPRPLRARALVGTTVGMVAGLGLYVSWLGPSLLP